MIAPPLTVREMWSRRLMARAEWLLVQRAQRNAAVTRPEVVEAPTASPMPKRSRVDLAKAVEVLEPLESPRGWDPYAAADTWRRRGRT